MVSKKSIIFSVLHKTCLPKLKGKIDRGIVKSTEEKQRQRRREGCREKPLILEWVQKLQGILE